MSAPLTRQDVEREVEDRLPSDCWHPAIAAALLAMAECELCGGTGSLTAKGNCYECHGTGLDQSRLHHGLDVLEGK